MQPDKSLHTASRQRVIRAVLGFFAGALLFLAFIQALTVTIAWWRNELPETQVADWFWILLLPVLIGIYFRYFSIFRPGCRACLPEDRTSQSGPRGP
jgi:FtsH-binding integral membrane protein